MSLSDLISDYHFDLPEELIAQRPVAGARDEARLLVVRKNPAAGMPQFEDLQVKDLPQLIKENDSLSASTWVRNRSRVLPARFYTLRNENSEHEVVLLHEFEPGLWRALIRRQARFKYPQELRLKLQPNVKIISPEAGVVDLRGIPGKLAEFLENYGEMPLPPYIKTRIRSEDFKAYQNPFALEDKVGSVAAPTASLHFTPQLQERIQSFGCNFADIILHVGLGTFEPVRVERLSQHELHAEGLEVSASTLKQIEDTYSKNNKEPSFVCIGTTAMRSLESLPLGGLPSPPQVELQKISDGSLLGHTKLFVRPGFNIRYTRALFTNFHLPESTLLVLVASFVGSRTLALEAYKHAVNKRYRFFSYGDASLWL